MRYGEALDGTTDPLSGDVDGVEGSAIGSSYALQAVVMNVSDLDRSVEFYTGVLGFTLLARRDQLAAISAPGTQGAQ